MLTISAETEELARRLARTIGKTPEDAIQDALQARAAAVGLNSDDDASDRDAMITAARAVVRQYRQLPIIDNRTPDEFLAYDEHGLPA